MKENLVDGFQEYEIQINAERECYMGKITELSDKMQLLTNEIERLTKVNQQSQLYCEEKQREKAQLKLDILECQKQKKDLECKIAQLQDLIIDLEERLKLLE